MSPYSQLSFLSHDFILINFVSFTCRPKKFTLKGYKRYWFAYKDLHLFLYKSKDQFRSNQAPALAINLRGCEVTPEVILAQGKFNIKLEVPPEDGFGANNEMWIRCENVRAQLLYFVALNRQRMLTDLRTNIITVNNFYLHSNRMINMPNGWPPVA